MGAEGLGIAGDLPVAPEASDGGEHFLKNQRELASPRRALAAGFMASAWRDGNAA
jgi:hypothetical protein